jgi:hypothetical protein
MLGAMKANCRNASLAFLHSASFPRAIGAPKKLMIEGRPHHRSCTLLADVAHSFMLVSLA